MRLDLLMPAQTINFTFMNSAGEEERTTGTLSEKRKYTIWRHFGLPTSPLSTNSHDLSHSKYVARGFPWYLFKTARSARSIIYHQCEDLERTGQTASAIPVHVGISLPTNPTDDISSLRLRIEDSLSYAWKNIRYHGPILSSSVE